MTSTLLYQLSSDIVEALHQNYFVQSRNTFAGCCFVEAQLPLLVTVDLITFVVQCVNMLLFDASCFVFYIAELIWNVTAGKLFSVLFVCCSVIQRSSIT